MIIDLAAYRRSRARPQPMACDVEQELICVNWQPARVLAARPTPVPPLPSPALPETDEELIAFAPLAYALATQI
jgi:hypothetical protein